MRQRINPDISIPETTRLGRFVDWMAHQLSPRWGARRALQRRMLPRVAKYMASGRGGWDSGFDDDERARKFFTSGLSSDAELLDQLETVRDRCVAAYKTDPVAHGAVEGRVTNEIGIGILPQARIRDEYGISEEEAEEINVELERVAGRWSDGKIDRKMVSDLPSVERVVCRTFAICGEAFIEMMDDPTRNNVLPLVCDTIDPRRIETPPWKENDPACVLGIQHDARGMVVGYWKRKLLDGDIMPQQVASGESHQYVEKYDRRGFVRMSHIYESFFPEQTRGWPWMAASLLSMKDVKDFSDATILAAQIESCFAGFIKSAGGNLLDQASAASYKTRGTHRLEEIQPGTLEYLDQDEDVVFSTPQKPGGTFAPFCEFRLRGIAASLDYSYELLHKNFFRTTYSSGRLAMLDGRMGFICRRQPIVNHWLKDLWRLIVFQSIFQTDVGQMVDLALYQQRPHVYERHLWQGQGWQSIDPLKEMNSHAVAVDKDLETRSESLGERGLDYDDFRRTRYREKQDEVTDDVAIRELKWKLEETAGLPHEEETNDPAMAGVGGDQEDSTDADSKEEREG